jgi:hypothetical protein
MRLTSVLRALGPHAGLIVFALVTEGETESSPRLRLAGPRKIHLSGRAGSHAASRAPEEGEAARPSNKRVHVRT